MKVSNNKTLIEEEWEDLYKPLKNHLEPNAPRCGDIFETFGEELEYVLSHDHQRIWTWIENIDENRTYIVNGFHHVNRLSYFICRNNWSEGLSIEVSLDW